MTPERASELLNHKTTAHSPYGGSITAQTIEIGNIRTHMTADEIAYVNAYWRSLPGTSSFYTTLLRIAEGTS